MTSERNQPRTPLGGTPPGEGLAAGITLVGHAFGELGVGEEVRMAALACQAAGLPVAVVNLDPGSGRVQRERVLADHVGDAFPYRATLLCLTGFDSIRAFLSLGLGGFGGRHVVGYWPWELARWPERWGCAFALIDELWVASRHTQRSFETVSPVPVRLMPSAVAICPPKDTDRRKFGLPADRFLFVFSFDGRSSLARKNPTGVVAAFRRAFPAGDEPVGLVVKAMDITVDPVGARLLREEIRSDPRIHLIAGTLTKSDVLELYAACDCFVTLHRAEGFGRAIAESMLLGKPVIATAYSGNRDFTRPDTAWLVDYQLVAVPPGGYPEGEGQVWAEPNLDSAAAGMIRLAADPVFAGALGERGRRFVARRHAPAVVGRRYRQRLDDLGLLDRPP